MKRKILCLCGIGVVALLLVACSSKHNTYKTESINVYYVDNKNNTICDIRYYNGSVIPYISLKDYNSYLYRGRKYPTGRDKFDINKNGDIYTVTVAGDYKATFDVQRNIIESDDLWNFKNTNLVGYGDNVSVAYDGLPFIRVKSVTTDKKADKTTIDLNKYDLNIYGDDNNIYVPISFASDLFSCENILQGAYNGRDLYITNFTENEQLASFGSNYYEPIFENSLNKEYASYVYNELCLNYDFFLGRPGRSSLEVYYDLSNGLDKALESRELGRTIKKYIKSTDLSEFLAGSTLLGYLREDGGHSGYSPLKTSYYDDVAKAYKSPAWNTGKVRENSYKLIDDINKKEYPELVNYDMQFNERANLRFDRKETLGKQSDTLKGKETYTKDGDVAYIHIDGFMGEVGLQNEWEDYYSGKRDTIPFGDNEGGAVGAMYYGLNEIAKDNEIKHLIIDLASNTGGSTDEMLYMIGILTGSEKFYTYNRMRNCYVTATYEFDYNFDKVFDEKDKEMQNLVKDIDISVLVTKNGFSCGGISPIYLHDEGLFTIGEESGGGSCSVFMQYDAYGNANRSSSPDLTVTKNKINVDLARKNCCDKVLEFPKKENSTLAIGSMVGSLDYGILYNTSELRKLINEHYNN